MKKRMILFSFIILCLYSQLLGTRELQQIIPQDKHEVEVRLVLVDVIVTRDGEFVKNLGKEDFELFKDGKKVPVNSFELISFEERKLKIS